MAKDVRGRSRVGGFDPSAPARRTFAITAVLLSTLILIVASIPLLILEALGDYRRGDGVSATGGPLRRPLVPASSAEGGVREGGELPNPAAKLNWTSSRFAGGGEGLGRFPRRGTAEFERECGWTTLRTQRTSSSPCVILVRPSPNAREGVAEWLSDAAGRYILAIQSGCRLLMDYGEGVDVTDVIEPPLQLGDLNDAENDDGSGAVFDWRVPPNFNFTCADGESDSSSELCVTPTKRDVGPMGRWVLSASVSRMLNRTGDPSDAARAESLADVPSYRFAATRKLLHFDDPSLLRLRETLPNFRLESGYACAHANLLRLSRPNAARYEPGLFDEILPSLHDPTALVLGMYVRTGLVERTDGKEKPKGTEMYDQAAAASGGANGTSVDYASLARRAVRCAERVERRYLNSDDFSSPGGVEFSSVVWAFFSDAPDLRAWMLETYSGSRVASSPGSAAVLRRKVVITSTTSAHSRLVERSPAQADFAGAVLDWYLLGETDAVVVDRGETVTSTFAHTAAMRTGRMAFDAGKKGDGCERRNLVWPEGAEKKKRRPKKREGGGKRRR